ncbi:hypothetical protein B0H34DRAFT_691855 [Crassisporium funariophilum]|nr:hypothetical protein B0H34DRAFT_691855 [Crassisporium funariophilum]
MGERSKGHVAPLCCRHRRRRPQRGRVSCHEEDGAADCRSQPHSRWSGMAGATENETDRLREHQGETEGESLRESRREIPRGSRGERGSYHCREPRRCQMLQGARWAYQHVCPYRDCRQVGMPWVRRLEGDYKATGRRSHIAAGAQAGAQGFGILKPKPKPKPGPLVV